MAEAAQGELTRLFLTVQLEMTGLVRTRDVAAFFSF